MATGTIRTLRDRGFGFIAPDGEDSRNELFSITFTADYALWKNLISRAEFRWDTALTGDRPFGGTTAGAGSDKNAVSLTANLVYMF